MKSAIRSMLRRAGLDIRRIAPGGGARSPFEAQVRLLANVTSPTIFDVGAHQGQTASRYAAAFPGATIHSFEPGADTFRALRGVLDTLPGAEGHQLAIGETCGRTTFHVNKWTQTSSLFHRPASSRRYFPEDAQMVRDVEVEVSTLDAFCAERSISQI
jgi:FkbM family methyltransferase